MSNERRAIISLLALGRVTPTQAERLLLCSNSIRDDRWIFAACIAASLLATLNPHHDPPTLMQILHGLWQARSVHHAVALLTRLSGEMQ
jgi:hypothetical protein